MTAARRVAVVGGSAAGLAVVEGLRREGFAGEVCWIGEEPGLPYDRPPLSKEFLSGAWDADRLQLRDEAALGALDVDRRFGVRATGVDLEACTVALEDGETVPYDRLVIATGSSARLPEQWRGISGVHVLRTLADATAIRDRLPSVRRVVLVGAGFIGAEAAAVLRGLGREVTLVDPLAVPMERALGLRLGGLVADLHREHGVDVRCGVSVTTIARDAGGLRVMLDDGARLAADLVLVGLGGVPNVGWLEGSGLAIGGGVLCDERCRAAPGVYAAGDVASWINPALGGRMRVEHRSNASEQGAFVAAALLDEDRPMAFSSVPFMWSDQYDRKIQIHGHVGPRDRMAVLEGSYDTRRLVAAYARDDRVTGVVGLNMPKQVRTARSLVVEGARWDDVARGLVAAGS